MRFEKWIGKIEKSYAKINNIYELIYKCSKA